MRSRRPLDDAPAGAVRRHRKRHTPSRSTRHASAARAHDVVAHVGGRDAPSSRPASSEVIRNSATVTFRKSSSSCRSSARERAGVQDEVRGHRAARKISREGCPATPSPRPAGVDRPGTTDASSRSATRAARSGLSLQPRAQLREACDELPRHPLVGERGRSRADLVQERLQGLGDRELRSVAGGLARGPGRLHPTGRARTSRSARSRSERGENEARTGAAPARRLPGDTVRLVQNEGEVAVDGDAGEAPAVRAEPYLDGDRPLARRRARTARGGRSARDSRRRSGPRGSASCRRRPRR